jgi:propionyl-CoA carboxylase alpha chain
MSRRLSALLVANRGEIARRVFRTARAMGLRCVAVYADADAGSPFVSDADEAVRLPGGYLDGDSIIAAARATGAEGIHPGYGFLAENAAFAESVIDAGLIWVGPPPAVIEAMGDKLAAKREAADAGIPVLASSDDPTAADRVGYPLIVKAAAGGGGKGMRVVDSHDALAESVAAAKREAQAAFADDRVFLERHVTKVRHIEVQILADDHGGLVHFGERECSIQRRHQKIIEESPSPIVDARMRDAMGDAALRLARTIGYRSAGTVEFLVDDGTREFFFLEVNTRLQVEHPVTEQVTGTDLVREQIRLATGQPLGYGQEAISLSGHAVEARLYAEDPAAGFLPASGRLAAFEPASQPAVRWDSGVAVGSVVSVDFDPMLAKVVAHAATREEAAGRLALALQRLHLGGVTTNRDFLVATLRHPAYLAGDTTTDFIERVAPATRLAISDDERQRLAGLAALWLQGQNRAGAPVLGSLPSGWRNARLPAQRVSLNHGDARIQVSYAPRRDGSFVVHAEPADEGPARVERSGAGLDGRSARIHSWSPSAIDVELDDRRTVARVTRHGDRLYVQAIGGTVAFDVVPRFPPPGADGPAGGLTAPMPGEVLDVRCSVGDRVDAQQTLVVLEAMKMEHHVRAPKAGIVAELRVSKGEQVQGGTVLLVLQDADPSGDAQRSE